MNQKVNLAMKIKRTYDSQQQLSKLTLGASEPILSHADKSFIDCFSENFLAIPYEKDVVNFQNSLSPQKIIHWDINADKMNY